MTIKEYVLAGHSTFSLNDTTYYIVYNRTKRYATCYLKVGDKKHYLFIWWPEDEKVTNLCHSHKLAKQNNLLWQYMLLLEYKVPDNRSICFRPSVNCPVCGRLLTNHVSVTEGIGPLCKERIYGIKMTEVNM